jgi:cytosine/adenosine deaminase-related metal-dependent hydrolase
MERHLVISGKAILGEDLSFQQVDIVIDNGFITAIEGNDKAPDIWICPALFNSHTHLGDTVAMDCAVSGDLVTLVAPPHGLKHQHLAKSSHHHLVRAMQMSIGEMVRSGTAGCADFREGGPDGVAALREASEGLDFRCVIFGRDGGEYTADGLGVSSTRDFPGINSHIAMARKEDKMIAFHAGEKDADDVDTALSFDPDLLIHGTYATHAQLRECAERSIPIVVCPRSNWTLGVASTPNHPPITEMLDLGCRVFLGTDNVMFVHPDMLAEMAFVHVVYHIEPVDVLRMAVAGSSIGNNPFFIQIGARANLFSIDPRFSNLRFSANPVASIIKRAFSGTMGTNVFNS